MPGSSPRGKVTTLDWRKELPKISSVLDVGPGWGTYSQFLRKKGETWDAVEIFEPYIKRFNLHKHYSNVYNTNILDFSPTRRYDLTILGDVLEHLERDDAKKALEQIFSYSNYCLLSLPLDEETHAELDNSYQYWNNEHEIHRSEWSNTSFQNLVATLGGEIIALKKYHDLAVYIIATKDSEKHLNEKISIFDHIRYATISFEGTPAVKQKLKYVIIQIVPRSLIGVLKRYFS